MDEYLNKYTQQKKTKSANSPRAEVVDIASKLVGKDFKQILGLTKHLQPDQIHEINTLAQGKAAYWWVIFQSKYMQNNILEEIKGKLEQYPQFRERKNIPEYLAKLSLRAIKLENVYKERPLTLLELSQFAIKYATYERNWRECLMKYEHLRGSDYSEKADAEQNFVRNLRK